MAFASLVIMASVPLLGGSLARLTRVRLQHAWLVVLALALQILITVVITGAPRWILVSLHLISYALAAVALWLNRRLPGLLLIGGGAMLNGVVITLNGGTLPASAHALRAAGHAIDAKSFENSGVLAHPILPWLGDVVATPSWLPFRNVLSIGDVTILIGTLVLAHSVCRRTGTHRRGAVTTAVPAVAQEQQLQPAA
jgi:Family of unknown function (DUF5317)